MGNRCVDYVTRALSRLVLAVLLISCSACGFNSPGQDFSLVAGANQPLDPRLEVKARLRHLTEEQIIVDYVLRNKSATDLIALTGNTQSLQAALLANGTVRLIQGEEETSNTYSDTKPAVVGQVLAAGASLHGSGGLLSLPLTFAFAQNSGNVKNQLDQFEFCIGYGLVDELLPERPEGKLLRVATTAAVDKAALDKAALDKNQKEYRFDSNLIQQRLACTKLSVHSQPSLVNASALDAEHWESALKGVISVLNNQSKHVMRKYAGALTLPYSAEEGSIDVVAFRREDGSVGNRSIFNCPGGGQYKVTETLELSETVLLNFDNCVNEAALPIGEVGDFKEVIGEEHINGIVERTIRINDSGEKVTSLRLRDFSVVNGSRGVHVLSGVYEYEDGHPFSRDVMIDMNVELVNKGQSIMLTNVESTDTSIFGKAYERGLAANFSVVAPWTLDQPLTVTMPVELAGMPIGGSSRVKGLLVLETTQGDRLTLDMTNVHENKVLIASDRAGVVTFEHREWDELFEQF